MKSCACLRVSAMQCDGWSSKLTYVCASNLFIFEFVEEECVYVCVRARTRFKGGSRLYKTFL